MRWRKWSGIGRVASQLLPCVPTPHPPTPPGGSLNDKGPCDAIVRKGVKYRVTSSECVIFLTSLDADLKVLALSDIRVTGNPRRLTNLRKANRNESTLKGVSYKWIALVDVHANKQMYTLSELFSFEDFPSRMYSGPMKSNPVWANGGSRDTRSIGKSGVGGGLYGAPTLLQMAHFLKIWFTTSRPLGTQNLCRMVVKVSLIPLCLILECTSWMMRLVSGCLDGSKIGFLLSSESGALLTLPLHLMICWSSRNKLNCVT